MQFNLVENKSVGYVKEVKVRPMPESGILKMRTWLMEESWDKVYNAESAHTKAEIFQQTLLDKVDEIFPEKLERLVL